MIKHIVFWKLKPQAEGRSSAENAQLAKQQLEALNGRIPGLLKLEVGIDFSGADSAFDIALYSEFESREALENYQRHPEHLAVAPLIRAIYCDRAMVDYEG